MDKLTATSLNNYLWESLQEFKNGNMTKGELLAIGNIADKMVKVSMLDIMSKNTIGNNKALALNDIKGADFHELR